MRIKLVYLSLLFALTSFIARAQAPTATIALPTNTFCTDVAYTFTANTTGSITAFSWSVTPSYAATFVNGNSASVTTVMFSSASSFSLTVFVANATGTFVTGQLISLNKSAKASYYASLSNAGFPADIILTNYSSNASQYTWDFGSAAPSQTLTNTTQSYSVAGTYSLALIAYGVSGCNDTLAYNFVVDDFSDVKLTNVFTPNEDGVNDVFKPITKGLSELNVWIYNRYGNILYNWTGTKGFWDGYTTSGIKCADGVYFYVIEAKGFDGKEYKLKSNLTLKR